MRIFLFLSLTFFYLSSIAQQNFIHLSDFYKDQLVRYSSNYFPDGQYPKNEHEYDLISSIRDSSKQYYTLTEVLFKKHLFEIKGDNYSISISPIVDLRIGKDLSDTNDRRLFMNNRGVFVEGDIGSNFSFSTEFHENQARFTEYQSIFYSQHGELYPGTNGYTQVNAVIPGESRTKPFKVDGFDYAFAVGYLAYRPHKNILLSAGNTSHFIGEGQHSLLIGNTSGNAPFLKVDWQIGKRWKVSHQRSRHLNLMRRVYTSSAEAYYESKGYSMNYITFQPFEGVGISFFEGNHWNRGDSITSYFSPAISYLPVPFMSSILQPDRTELNSIRGLNLVINRFKDHLIYGQLVTDDLQFDDLGGQIGYKGFDVFGVQQLMLQLEFNTIPSYFYENSENTRLNYSHYNMPLAHVLGNGFREIFTKLAYEKSRIYSELIIDYSDRDAQPGTPLLSYTVPQNGKGFSSVFLTSIEVGYRFNKKMNLCAFGQVTYRSENTFRNTTFISGGLKTAIRNRSYIF